MLAWFTSAFSQCSIYTVIVTSNKCLFYANYIIIKIIFHSLPYSLRKSLNITPGREDQFSAGMGSSRTNLAIFIFAFGGSTHVSVPTGPMCENNKRIHIYNHNWRAKNHWPLWNYHWGMFVSNKDKLMKPLSYLQIILKLFMKR